jgi:inner membrane protein
MPGAFGNVLPACLAAVVLANAPDLDYIPGLFVGDWNALHHGYTHTLGWVALVAAGIWMLRRTYRPTAGWGLLAFILVALLSHLVADLLTDDGRPPYGIMLGWPFSSEYLISPVTPFWRLEKKDLADVLQWYNVKAVLVEVAWTAPLLVVVLLYKARGPILPRAAPVPSRDLVG